MEEQPIVKLYQLERGAKIKALEAATGEYITIIFDHVDGMYSYCETEDGRVCHLAVYTSLVKEGDYYKIVDDAIQ